MTRHERQRERRLLSDQLKNAGPIDGTPIGIDDLRHIAWWDNNGPTNITNLGLLRPKCHKKKSTSTATRSSKTLPVATD